jgi:multidrug efflux pump subunit AcrB
MPHNKPYEIKDVAGKLAIGFLRNPLTAVLGIVLIAIGWIALNTMPREEDPQIAISGGSIIVPMPGVTPSEIENVIVKPLEKKLREVQGIEHIYGMAIENVGIVNVMYYIGENREDSNLKLYDKVMQNMDKLPKGTMQPIIKPFDIDIDVPIMTVALYQKPNSKLNPYDFLEEVQAFQHKINAIENVAKTTLQGEHIEQFNVEVDMGKLSAYHLSMGKLMQAIQSLAFSVNNVK